MKELELKNEEKIIFTNDLNEEIKPDYIPKTIKCKKENFNILYPYFNKKPREGFQKWRIRSGDEEKIVKTFQELDMFLMKKSEPYFILQEFIEPLLYKGFMFLIDIEIKSSKKDGIFKVECSKRGNFQCSEKPYDPNNFEENEIKGEIKEYPEDFWREFGKRNWDKIIFPQIKKILRLYH